MKPCVTISLVEEARGGPFVYWHDPLTNARRAQSLGFPAIEIFPPDADALSPSKLPDIPSETGQSVAAIGSGGGWVRNRWHLTHPSAEIRQKELDFFRRLLDAEARFLNTRIQSTPTIGAMSPNKNSSCPNVIQEPPFWL